ncbi:MAG: heme exporter protein CcmD [Chromatiales bacterium]|nr:heme exporter protein CcmD [Chromatiales bacterium]
MAEFLAMGGHGPYVWAAFGISAVVLAANVVAARRGEKWTRERLARRLARQSRRSGEG